MMKFFTTWTLLFFFLKKKACGVVCGRVVDLEGLTRGVS